jgi:hypothetical protein
MKPNCYKCVHRGNLPGDAHSRCNHPLASMSIFVTHENPLGIEAAAHGIKNGWFFWPLNFDPVWLEACNGFEAKAVPTEATV